MLTALRRRFSSMAMGLANPQQRVHVTEALTFVRALDFARFEASVDCVIKLNVDVKRTDERVRGMAFLPHGTGKAVRVAVFARGALADEATDAGADLVGAEDLVEQVMQGRIEFERCLATPDMLPVLAKAARVLGPRGLMPNPKRGGVVGVGIGDAVQRAKAGEVEFKTNKEGLVHGAVGKVTLAPKKLQENVVAFM
jgi:large subunit ribosomal protein L1